VLGGTLVVPLLASGAEADSFLAPSDARLNAVLFYGGAGSIYRNKSKPLSLTWTIFSKMFFSTRLNAALFYGERRRFSSSFFVSSVPLCFKVLGFSIFQSRRFRRFWQFPFRLWL
jgi:hypothetical protein